MSKKVLEVRYHLEIYPDSIINDPIFYCEARSPLPVPNIGDEMDPRTFEQSEFIGTTVKVVNVKHLWWKVEGSHISHKLLIVVEQSDDQE